MTVWIGAGSDGQFVVPSEATVSVFDHGFTVGDGIFETMKAIDGRVFLWPWHLERLHQSAARMGIALPSDAHLTELVTAIAHRNLESIGSAARVRLTVSAGSGPLGSARLKAPTTIVCAASALPVRPGPARLHVVPWPRNERSPLAGVKSTSYAENVLALADAEAAGAGEALFFNIADMLCEGTGSNVFVVKAGEVITPPASAGLLPGVTRRFVLGLGDAGVPVREGGISREAFAQVDEVFITSTFQNVRGVCDIDGRRLAVGPVTRELQDRFALAASAADCWT